MRSPPKRIIKSSSNDKKNCEYPLSPWRPARPRNWLSIRRDSCRSVPITARPPKSDTPGPSLMSVPRPAMLVAIVTAPRWPALATISASLAWFFAFKTLCGIPSRSSNWDNNSDVSTATVPIKIGWPFSWSSLTKATTAINLERKLGYNKSGSSIRCTGRFVGISTISML